MCDAETVVQNATNNQYSQLSDKQLWMVIAQLLCDVSS